MTRGPLPKDPATRQRRNKSATNAILETPEEPDFESVPDMGVLADEDWHPLAVAWWQSVWTSPMATQYLDADRHTLFRLLMLVQEYWMRPNVELSKEIDKAQQPFGLTPMDRRRLEWIVEQAPPSRKTLTNVPSNVISISGGPDPRRGLV